jgi:hypothetical protein
MVFLVMNTCCSKHAEDTKNLIKTLILKSVHFVGFHYIIVSLCTVQKTSCSTYCCLTMTIFLYVFFKSETAKNSLCCLTYQVTC